MSVERPVPLCNSAQPQQQWYRSSSTCMATATSDTPPSYEDCNAGPPLNLRLKESKEIYTAHDVIPASIEMILTPGMKELFSKRSYSRVFVFLELKCHLASHMVALRPYNIIYHCRRVLAVEVEGPFSEDANICGPYMRNFKLRLCHLLDRPPPSISLNNFPASTGEIKWELSSCVEGVNQDGSFDILHWTKTREKLNIYTRSQIFTPRSVLMERKLTHRWIENEFDLEIRELPCYLPQGPETFRIDYCFYTKSNFFLHTVEFFLRTQLNFRFDGKIYSFTRKVLLCSVEYDQWVIAKELSGVAEQCSTIYEWPESFGHPPRSQIWLQHDIYVMVYTENASKCYIRSINVMQPAWMFEK